jgi:PEP-CTERM motif
MKFCSASRTSVLLSTLLTAAIAARCPNFVRADVPVEQVEALTSDSGNPPFTEYAPISFNGSTTATSSSYPGITFNALDATDASPSAHAEAVANLIYGPGAPGALYVTTVYNADADSFIENTIDPQTALSTDGPAPGTFAPGVLVINNSYVGSVADADPPQSNLDAIRRLDFMIQQADVTFVAAAAIDNSSLAGAYLDWSAYNSLAVAGNLTDFQPGTDLPGKTHTDVITGGLASFATAAVSGYVTSLYGHAQAAAQTSAQHDVVMRSLIMAGADKSGYARQTTNNLSITEGAGFADYANSLSILNAGQQPILPITSNNIAGSPTSNSQGWSYGSITANTQDAVLFHSNTSINGITASLNWDVTQIQPAPGEINTTDAGTIFPTLGLEVRPVTLVSGQYVLGASLGDLTLQSYLPANTDNVEYIYSTTTLPAGNYAFMITGDSALTTNVGFSYTLALPPEWNVDSAGDWNSAANWANRTIPNGIDQTATLGAVITAAHTVFTDTPITLGTLHFNNPNTYVLTGAGSLTMQVSTGSAAINVDQGTQKINLPLTLASNTTATIQSGATLIIGNPLTLNADTNLNVTGGGTMNIESLVNLGAGSSITVTSGTTFLGDPTLSLGDDNLPIRVAGTMDISDMSLDLNLQSAPDGQYVLIDYSDGGTILGQFTSIDGLPAGAVIDYTGTTANPDSIIVVIVPEPTSLSLLMGIGMLTLRRRRK